MTASDQRKLPCPICGYFTLPAERPEYAGCAVCTWENDFLQLAYPEERGANKVTLTDARRNFSLHGAKVADPGRAPRTPLPEESPPLDVQSVNEYVLLRLYGAPPGFFRYFKPLDDAPLREAMRKSAARQSLSTAAPTDPQDFETEQEIESESVLDALLQVRQFVLEFAADEICDLWLWRTEIDRLVPALPPSMRVEALLLSIFDLLTAGYVVAGRPIAPPLGSTDVKFEVWHEAPGEIVEWIRGQLSALGRPVKSSDHIVFFRATPRGQSVAGSGEPEEPPSL